MTISFDDRQRGGCTFVSRVQDHTQHPMNSGYSFFGSAVIPSRPSRIAKEGTKCFLLDTQPDGEVGAFFIAPALAGEERAWG